MNTGTPASTPTDRRCGRTSPQTFRKKVEERAADPAPAG